MSIYVPDSKQIVFASNCDPAAGRCLNGTKKSRYVFTVPGLLQKDDRVTNHLTIRLLHLECPHVFFTVTTANSLLRVLSSAVNYDCVIPTGNYNSQTLLAFFQGWFAANAPTLAMTVSLSDLNGTLQFSASAAFSIAAASTSQRILGFVPGSSSVFNGTRHVIQCPGLLDLSGIKQLHIRVPGYAFNSFNTQNLVPDILRSIPVNVAPFSILFWDDKIGTELVINTFLQSNDIEVMLVDGESGLEVDMSGADWQMVVQITSHTYVTPRPLLLGGTLANSGPSEN
eukprot:gene24658-29793_t